MSKEESPAVIIKNEPCNDDVHYINDKIFLDEAKTKVDLEYITEDMKEECLMEIKQEEIIIKDEIPSSSDTDTQNDLTDDNVAFTAIGLLSTSLNTQANSIKTGEKQLACTFSQYKTSRKRDLQRHIDCHTKQKSTRCTKLRCAECDYETSWKTNLVHHIMVVHTGEKPFACNLCEFRTTRRSSLHQHMMKHTGEKPFACNICEYKSALKGCLNQHMIKHTGETFNCNLCEFKTVRRSNLNIHMMKHAGEKPFVCNLCEFKTAFKGDLNRHAMKHKGEKSFACNICEFKSARKNHLKQHIMRHISGKPFCCNKCKLRFNTKRGLKYHTRTHADGKQQEMAIYINSNKMII